ncbi:ABC transporter ATP-binding protein [Pelagicoccus sp. SDUM812003]|uniref:ABC transporter ATP-binding protein n=1 Tax=Pelagicoccus sp. SDUM812003 TaxID=3041267 RepID=UPI00280FFBA0|nr:ABC transporter ATP-binding protein [Pelagicoccus sp. SDUM812003]MDQ8204188.1 ABC transporter ATP-binding protein [Pelagicoccus sp. SDUM812003]
MTALLASQLSKSFGPIKALDQLDLAIEDGSFFGLLGPNGAGKSTFMSLVSGFQKPDSGTLQLFGVALDAENLQQKKTIGFAPQHIALYPEFTAEKNLSFFGKLYGLSGKDLAHRIDSVLDIAQLADRRRSRVKDFSGGMKRRLNIACALLHQPRILLCDEPTVGVDPQSRNAIFDTLRAMKEQGMTVVYSTHYMEEAERLCDTIAIIDQGRILRRGTLEELLSDLPHDTLISLRRGTLAEPQLAALSQFGTVRESGHHYQLQPGETFKLSRFFGWAEEQDIPAQTFQIQRPSLEDLFLHLTGRDLRE